MIIYIQYSDIYNNIYTIINDKIIWTLISSLLLCFLSFPSFHPRFWSLIEWHSFTIIGLILSSSLDPTLPSLFGSLSKFDFHSFHSASARKYQIGSYFSLQLSNFSPLYNIDQTY